MFNRKFQAGEHRQHIRPPGASAAPFGVQRVADYGEMPVAQEDMSVQDMDMGLEEPMDDYDFSVASRTSTTTYFGKPSSSSQARLLQRYSKPSKLRSLTFDDLDQLEEFTIAQGQMCPMDSIEVDDVLRGIKAARKWKTKNGYTASRTAGTEKVRGEAQVGDLVTYHDMANQRGEVWEVVEPPEGDSFTPSGIAFPGRGYKLRNVETGADHWSDLRQNGWTFATDFDLGRNASRRSASRRKAFLDTIELTPVRHKVAGWSWDDHLNGFIAAEAAREFTCACGDSVPAPGYTDCRCGKRWNTYSVSANGTKKMIAREVPVRDNVVMAGRTASRRTSAVTWYDQSDQFGEMWVTYSQWPPVGPYAIASPTAGPDFSWHVSDKGGSIQDQFGTASSLEEAKSQAEQALASAGVTAKRRKIAAPSSGADAIAQHFPGWLVDDENGDFWEIQSPGREHAFIHEGGGVYTVLTNDGTPDEFHETGLSFEDALEEMRAEGVI